MALSTTLLRILMKCHRLYIHQSIISAVLFSEPRFHWLDEYWSVKGHRSVSNQSCLRNGQLLLTASGQHQRDAPAVHNNPYGQYYLSPLPRRCIVVFMHIYCMRWAAKGKSHFWDTVTNVWGTSFALFIASVASHKDYKCFAEMGFTLIHQVPRPRWL